MPDIVWRCSRSLLQASAASPQGSVVQQRLTLVLAIMTAMEGEEASDALISDAMRIASTVRALSFLHLPVGCHIKDLGRIL